jgi:hypothetical protein
MRISELLNSIASWLESPNNEALLLSEYDEECSKIVAENCVLAAALLKNAAEQVEDIEPPPPSNITPESIEELAKIANAFDQSGFEDLIKQASVIDELLLTIASPPNAYAERKDLQESRIKDLQERYNTPKDKKIVESEKAINKSNMTKEYKVLEAPLSTRYCPDHAGVQVARTGQHEWQCSLDKKIYNFDNGFDLANGDHVPGGSVSEQTIGLDTPSHSMFDSRVERLMTNKV